MAGERILNFLLKQGCKVTDDGSIYTDKGDYVGLKGIITDDGIVKDIIWKHKLTKLMSVNTAAGFESGTAVGVGFSEEEQKWYGWTHRGFGAFGIGQIVKEGTLPTTAPNFPVKAGFTCKTLDDCLQCAIAMSDSLD